MLVVVGPRSSGRITGLSIAIDTLCEGLKERGIAFSVIDLNFGGAPARSGAFSVRRLLSTIVSIARFYVSLARGKVVYIPIAPTLLGFARDALMIWGASLLGRRILLHFHGGGYRLFFDSLSWPIQRVVKATLRRAGSIIVLADKMRADFSFVDSTSTRIEVVPNGLSISSVGSRNVTAKQFRGEPIRILYLSNMIESKGYLDVLEACRLLRDNYRIPFYCTFCGEFIRTVVDRSDGPEDYAEARFRNMISSTGLDNLVSYLGSVRGETKWKMLSEADLFVLPSYYPWEGQPISIIEALAFGLPVIATRYRGIPDLVVHGYNGILVERQSPEQIAYAIADLYQDPAKWTEFSTNGYRHYEQGFTREAHLAKLIPAILGHPAVPEMRAS